MFCGSSGGFRAQRSRQEISQWVYLVCVIIIISYWWVMFGVIYIWESIGRYIVSPHEGLSITMLQCIINSGQQWRVATLYRSVWWHLELWELPGRLFAVYNLCVCVTCLWPDVRKLFYSLSSPPLPSSQSVLRFSFFSWIIKRARVYHSHS